MRLAATPLPLEQLHDRLQPRYKHLWERLVHLSWYYHPFPATNPPSTF